MFVIKDMIIPILMVVGMVISVPMLVICRRMIRTAKSYDELCSIYTHLISKRAMATILETDLDINISGYLKWTEDDETKLQRVKTIVTELPLIFNDKEHVLIVSRKYGRLLKDASKLIKESKSWGIEEEESIKVRINQ